MQPVVCAAIEGRQLLRFAYHGAERIVEPYAHGYTSAGLETLSGFQIDGQSVHGQVVGWKMFHLADMVNVRPVGLFPEPRPGYDPTQLRISHICCLLTRVPQYITK